MRWQHAGGTFEWGNRPLLMGILNVTPDSFSDGGKYLEPGLAIERALKLFEDGASVVDVGGESTRPGAAQLGSAEELERVLPVIAGILAAQPNAVLSIDTYKAETARQAIAAGVAIINDVGGLTWDEGMLETLVQSKAGYIGMHSRGRPPVMQENPVYHDVVDEVMITLATLKEKLLQSGLEEERLVLDTGIGFGKTAEHNMEILRARDRWTSLQRPMLWGISKKSFISRVVGSDDRASGSWAIHAWLRSGEGPQIWRVHEVREMKEFLDMWDLLT